MGFQPTQTQLLTSIIRVNNCVRVGVKTLLHLLFFTFFVFKYLHNIKNKNNSFYDILIYDNLVNLLIMYFL